MLTPDEYQEVSGRTTEDWKSGRHHGYSWDEFIWIWGGYQMQPIQSVMLCWCCHQIQCTLHVDGETVLPMSISHLNWYKMVCIMIYNKDSFTKKYDICHFKNLGTQVLFYKKYLHLNTEPCSFHVWECMTCPDHLRSVCRNILVCSVFRAVAIRVIHLAFISWWILFIRCPCIYCGIMTPYGIRY